MYIIITGGCGFIGSNLAIELSKSGNNITCFDNLSRRGSEINLRRLTESGINYVHGDIRNSEDLFKLKDSYDLMIECSAEPSVLMGSKGDDAYYLINNNLYGSVNCFEFCRKNEIPIIFLSTSRVYPYDVINDMNFNEKETRFEIQNPDSSFYNGITENFNLTGYRSLYGATKLASEHLLVEYSKNFNIPSIINRCGVVAGPWQFGKADQGVFTYWMVKHYFNKKLSYIGFGGKGKQVRDLLHINDLVALIKIQIENISKHRGTIVNAGGGRNSNLSLMETTELCAEITGMNLSVSSDEQNRSADVIWYISDNRNAENIFGWKPQISPKNILADIFNWLRENENIVKNVFVNI